MDRYRQLQRLFSEQTQGSDLEAGEISKVIEFARDAMGTGRADLAIPLLEPLTAHAGRMSQGWQLLGFAYRDEQRMAESARAFARAAELDPHDALTALGHAQTCFESGLPALPLVRRALALAPDDPGALRGCAAALAAEGEAAAADTLLAGALVRRPDWIEGHKSLAALRWLAGDTRDFARSFAVACRVQPQNLALRLAWFRAVAQARDWQAVLAIIEEGESVFGNTPAFAVARTFVASESGDRTRAEQLFAQTATLRDDVRDLAYIRHCLRTGQLEQAESTALRLIETPSAAITWPYLSLIWRLRGDARAPWLDGAPPYIRVFDLGFSEGELHQLATLLRALHVARAPYLEQSVRGGTQTDRPLFFRHEPIIQTTRTKIVAAIREYIDALPGFEQGHPLLGTARGSIRFEGSWSVRLKGEGFHVSHTHPMGWISSAFYVSLPGPVQMGAAPSGWINFGTPPPELGLELPPYTQIEPKPGRLVLFPSTMWHSTMPFADGERLVIAFDVRMPRFESML